MIKRMIMVFFSCCLLFSGVLTVMAAPPAVTSDPAVFAIIKTDSCNSNIVQIANNTISFTPGAGIGGQIFGFQPNSTYTYKDLIRIENISDTPIKVWYTLDGDLIKLYNEGIFALGYAVSPSGLWQAAGLDSPRKSADQYEYLVLSEKGQRSEAIDMYFTMPAELSEVSSMSGKITFFAEASAEEIIVEPEDPGVGPDPEGPQEIEVEPEPPLGSLPQTSALHHGWLYGAGYLLVLLGLKVRNKGKK